MALGDSLAGLLAVILAAAVFVAAWTLRRLRSHEREAGRQARSLALYAELLNAAPGGACLWHGTARRFEMTPSLRPLIGLDAESGWGECLARPTDPDRQRLSEAAR